MFSVVLFHSFMPAGFTDDCCFSVIAEQFGRRLTKLFHRNIKNAVSVATREVA